MPFPSNIGVSSLLWYTYIPLPFAWQPAVLNWHTSFLLVLDLCRCAESNTKICVIDKLDRGMNTAVVRCHYVVNKSVNFFIRKDYDKNRQNIKVTSSTCATISYMSWTILWKYGKGLVCMARGQDIKVFAILWCTSEGEGRASQDWFENCIRSPKI
jgi:hypothetical protein